VPRKELAEDEAVGVVAHQRRREAAATRWSRSCASRGASAWLLHRCPPCEREERESCVCVRERDKDGAGDKNERRDLREREREKQTSGCGSMRVVRYFRR
jgi:hypothetical protein